MKISTKGRYALRMLVYITDNSSDDAVSLTEISEKQQISKKYLEQIVPMLTRAGILRAVRGNRGGYTLTKAPEEVTVGDVLRATEGSLAPVSCLDTEPNMCPRREQCSTLFVWEGLYDVVKSYLDGITLKDIAERGVHEGFDGTGGDDQCK